MGKKWCLKKASRRRSQFGSMSEREIRPDVVSYYDAKKRWGAVFVEDYEGYTYVGELMYV